MTIKPPPSTEIIIFGIMISLALIVAFGRAS